MTEYHGPGVVIYPNERGEYYIPPGVYEAPVTLAWTGAPGRGVIELDGRGRGREREFMELLAPAITAEDRKLVPTLADLVGRGVEINTFEDLIAYQDRLQYHDLQDLVDFVNDVAEAAGPTVRGHHINIASEEYGLRIASRESKPR